MKRILLTTFSTMALLSSTTHARNHGPYIGAGLGCSVVIHDARLMETPQVNHFGFNKTAAVLDLILGYAVRVNFIHLGVEFDYLFSQINKVNTFRDNGVTKLTTRVDSNNGQWGGAFRFGYHCHDKFVAYIRLGFEDRNFKLHYSNTALLESADSSTRKTAFTPGIGFSYMFNPHVSASLEYRYAIYKRIGLTGLNLEYSVKPRISTGLLSLKYHF